MRVVFLNPMFGPGFTKSARWFARSRGRVQRHPDYLCTAAAVLEKDGHDVLLIDAQAKNLPTATLLPHIKEFRPDLIVYQTSTPSIDEDIRAAKLCKESTSAINVFVGPHVTAEPVDTLNRANGMVDIVALGEYDYTLRDIANGISTEKCLGIAWRKGDEVIINPRRPFIQNLDELPFPAWHHINIRDYRDAGKLFPFITLISGRGCWGHCTFCLFPQVMNGRAYRPRSIEHIMEEITYDLTLFPDLQEIMFEDDTLVAPKNRERLEQLCEALLNRKGKKIKWSANARVDGADLPLLRLMKRAGCRMLCVGFEFGEQKILDRCKKGTTINEMRHFANAAHAAGIRVHGCFMIGGPDETWESALKTIELACSLPLDTVQFSGVVAYPGTEFYQWAKENGYLVPQQWRDWVDENFEQVTTLNLPGLSTQDINKLVDLGLRRFYLRPKQILRMLCNVRSWSDIRSKWYGLKSFVNYFNKQNC